MQRILVVDDDREIVRMVRTYLEQAGFQVFTAYAGATAMHSIRHDQPDLVVLDVMLPDQDGWQITRLVRSDPHLAALPIILLTARIEDTDKIVGLELGADDFLQKPVNPVILKARINSSLEKKRLRDQEQAFLAQLQIERSKSERLLLE